MKNSFPLILLTFLIACSYNTKDKTDKDTTSLDVSTADTLNKSTTSSTIEFSNISPYSNKNFSIHQSKSPEKYFPYFNCVELKSDPIDTLKIDKYGTIGFLYQYNMNELDSVCREYYRKFKTSTGINFNDASTMFKYDSLREAIIYLSGNGYDTLYNIESDGEGRRKYSVRAYFEFMNSYLITEAGPEGYSNILLNKNSREKTYIMGDPDFNPSRTLFTTTYFDEIGGESFMSLYSISPDKISEEYSIQFNRVYNEHFHMPIKPIWINDSSFLYSNFNFGSLNSDGKYYVLQLK